MPVPEQLHRVIDTTLSFMMQDREYSVPPWYRQQIYDTLRSAKDPSGSRTYCTLGIMTVRYVKPIWQDLFPDNNFPERMLSVVEGVLDGSVDKKAADNEAEKAWEYLEEFGSSETVLQSGSVFFVAAAALETLFAALGKPPFGAGYHDIINETTTDADLDPWCTDVALWAAMAYSQTKWRPSPKQRRFWEWWLREAIPEGYLRVAGR